MAINIGIIGQTGQLAKALQSACQAENLNYMALGREALDLSSEDKDIASALEGLLKIDVLINAAAYTAVDNAETDKEAAFRVNANAPKCFAQFCQAKAIPLVHISTDYVFNGKNSSPYKTDQKTDPLGVYGQTKLQGEDFIRDITKNYAILRTSWVYDGQGKNFMTTMLRLAQDRNTLNVVNDQLGRPTYAKDLAKACLIVAKALIKDSNEYAGTYHVSNTGSVISWADFARTIFEKANAYLPHNVTVKGIPSNEYPTPAKRPAYSAMDVSDFETRFDFPLPDWSDGLDRAIADWIDLNGRT